jgi:zinc/manganese transport system permease protein
MTNLWSGEPFSWNFVTDLRFMLAFEFMRNAFEAGTMISVIAGVVGYFVVLRRSSFASHALGHTGFSGAAAAVLVNVEPVYGLLVFTMAAASAMAFLGNKATNRDIEIGTVLAFALGVGLLFISLYQGYATEAYSILFGEVLGISATQVLFTFWASVAVLAAVAMIYRPLLFASMDEEVAEARGLPMLFLGLVFLLLLAVTISFAVQIIGVLLIFALMVTPAAIAVRLTSRVGTAVVVSILIAVSATWAGLFIGFYLAPPVSFFITGITFGEYIVLRGLGVLRESPFLQAVDAPEPDGVRSLRNAALTSAVSQILLLAGVVLLAEGLLVNPGASWNATALWTHARLAIVLLVPGAVGALASYLLYFSGFRKMATTSRDFTPAAFLTLTGMLGLALTAGGLALFLAGVDLNATGYALAPVAILFGVPILGLGLVLSLIGVYGQAAGSWRVGQRYQEGALRSGAVLMIVPILGSAVAFLGYRRALARGAPAGPSPPKAASS